MYKRVKIGLLLLILALILAGCGTSTSKDQPQNSGTNKTPSTQESKPVHLKPVQEGTPLVTSNTEVSKQIMEQKDVLGTQIYEQQGIVYGDISFKGEVDKGYAHDLANEFLTQLKVSYPNRQITTQVIIDGKTTDAISFKP